MNVRLENIHSGTPGNYVSFGGQAPRRARHAADADSLRSVSSVRSVMSNVSSIWSSIRSSVRDGKKDSQHREDMRYLYSCFTKIPALRLAPDIRAKLIAGFEEFPFDTAVPVFVFKNLSCLEVIDLDFRQIYGWDALSKQLRTLTIRRGQLDDPTDVLVDVVLDDIDKRRRRSSRAPVPTTPSTPGGSWMLTSRPRYAELSSSYSNPATPYTKQRSGSLVELPPSATPGTPGQVRQRSCSPPQQRPGSGPMAVINHNLTTDARRSSSSQGSSLHRTTSRQKSVDLIAFTVLPTSAWQFLRHLSLAENGLHYISAASLAPVAPTLQSLDLSSNLFTDIPDALASLSQLRALNLSNCMIDSLRSLSRSPLPAITTLNLRGNRIYSLAGTEKLYSLEKIDLRENKFVDPSEMARLSGIPYLSHVYVAKNSFTKTHPEYRTTIFNIFRRTPGRTEDIMIDSQGPMNNEKSKLVDMAPDLPTVAVVKPEAEDLCVEDNVVFVDRTNSAQGSDIKTDVEVIAIPVSTPPRRKKPSRKRVVQLTASEPGSPIPPPSGKSKSTSYHDTTPDPPAVDPRAQALAANAAYQEALAALKPDISDERPIPDDSFTTQPRTPLPDRQVSIGHRTLG